VQAIVDEAMGRRITNQAMIQQLDMLRDAIHRGYYMIEAYRCQFHNKVKDKDHIVSHSSHSSKPISVQNFCFSSGTSTQILEEMNGVLDSLSSMVLDASELILFLESYPRMYREPYSMHILLRNCMFGRQMETELIINFLLHSESGVVLKNWRSYRLSVLAELGKAPSLPMCVRMKESATISRKSSSCTNMIL